MVREFLAVVVRAALQWVLASLLLANGVAFCLIAAVASTLLLGPPCLLCARVHRLLCCCCSSSSSDTAGCSQEHDALRRLLCDAHVAAIAVAALARSEQEQRRGRRGRRRQWGMAGRGCCRRLCGQASRLGDPIGKAVVGGPSSPPISWLFPAPPHSSVLPRTDRGASDPTPPVPCSTPAPSLLLQRTTTTPPRAGERAGKGRGAALGVGRPGVGGATDLARDGADMRGEVVGGGRGCDGGGGGGVVTGGSEEGEEGEDAVAREQR